MNDRTAERSLTSYERKQSFNPVISWLHSFRYRQILEVFDRLAAEIGDRPIRVVEVGAAYGKLFEVVGAHHALDFTGIEMQTLRVEEARTRHGHLPNFRIRQGSAADPAMWEGIVEPDIVVALETLEHIPERDVVRVIEHIAALGPRRFVCSVPVEVGPALWCKNVGSWAVGYVRHKEYLWSETFWGGLYRLDRLPPHSIGHRGFDWRWLAHTIRHYFAITAIHRFPSPLLPTALSTSVFIEATSRLPNDPA